MIIYHNSRCKKSREALNFLLNKKIDVQVIEYLKNGLTVNEIKILLEKLNLSYDIVKDQFKEHISESKDSYDDVSSSQTFDDEPEDDESSIEQNPFNVKPSSNKSKKSKTPVLDNFGRDLTLFASEGKLDPIIGRHKEI